MSANQRRSGFRLPWLADDDAQGTASSTDAAPAASDEPTVEPAAAASGVAAAPAPAPPASTNGTQADQPTEAQAPASSATPSPEPGAAANPEATAEPSNPFIRDLIAAMRKVADEARTSGVDKLRADADEAVRSLEADAEKRRQELRERADADVNGVGEWARAEAQRISEEAERRVAARRAQLEEQLAAEGTRTEAEAKALRTRVDEYERELEAFHVQLSEINDPAAFAAAAKRMPAPPPLVAGTPAVAPGATDDGTSSGPAASPPATEAAAPAASDPEVHPAEEEVLAARLAELDEKLEAPSAPEPAVSAEPAPTTATDGASVTTDIVVKGLGSFGAITGFRQSLSGQSGITAVALSLGQNGEFVFRATHAPGFDLAGAITAMEGDGATVEPRPEGGLRVTLERSR